MAEFEFSLRRVLEFKARVEERIQGELAIIFAELEEAKNSIAVLDGKIEDSRRELQVTLSSPRVDTFAIEGYRHYIVRLNHERAAMVEKTLEIGERLDAKRGELVEAMREKKVLEKLGEKERARFMKDLLAREQAMLDEMALVKRGGFDA